MQQMLHNFMCQYIAVTLIRSFLELIETVNLTLSE